MCEWIVDDVKGTEGSTSDAGEKSAGSRTESGTMGRKNSRCVTVDSDNDVGRAELTMKLFMTNKRNQQRISLVEGGRELREGRSGAMQACG